MGTWEYSLDSYSYDDGGLAAMFRDRSHLDRRRDDGWYIRETFRGLKGVDVLWERERPSAHKPAPGATPAPEEAPEPPKPRSRTAKEPVALAPDDSDPPPKKHARDGAHAKPPAKPTRRRRGGATAKAAKK